jgi:hypothetical protein
VKTFVLYRKSPPEGHLKGGYANAPKEIQLEGALFTDGTVVVRWMTLYRSTSTWANWDTFYQVHGHPEYDSEIVWNPPLDRS